jgi:hypothetical protein
MCDAGSNSPIISPLPSSGDGGVLLLMLSVLELGTFGILRGSISFVGEAKLYKIPERGKRRRWNTWSSGANP